MGICCNREVNVVPKNKQVSIYASKTQGSIPISASLFVNKKEYSTIVVEYKILNFIGKGSFGIVQTVLHFQSNQIRAMKTIARENFVEEEDKFIAEIDILKRLSHPNIVKIFDFYYSKTHYYIITEYIQGGELFEKIQELFTLTEKMAAGVMRQILKGIGYCHSEGIAHRDLKPENILLDYDDEKKETFTIKIIDFGTSKPFKANQKLREKTGTANLLLSLIT